MFYIITIEEPTPHLIKQVAKWISSNLSLFCFLYPYLQFSIDNDLGWWHMAKRKKMQLLWNPRKSWRCFFAASWYPTDLKCVKKKFRNASKNLLTCAWLAIRKNLSYILDHSVVRQQAINISYICSLPVIQSWQLHAVLVLVGLGSCVNYYFILQV